MSAGTKMRKIIKWILIVLLSAFLVFFYGVVPWFLTGIVTTSRFHFRDPDDGKTPKDFGMTFQPAEFRSPDGILLRGWYVPADAAGDEARGTIIFCHGQNRTRVEMLPYATFAHGLGYNTLLFDLRHQGASDGKVGSVGYWERLDAEGAVQYALTELQARRPVILWGVSMGAAAALMAAADSPDVAAVISDSTFLNFKELIFHHYTLFTEIIRQRAWWFPPLPRFPLAYEVLYWSAWRGHFDPSKFDLDAAVRKINPRPILFIAVQGDARMPPWYAQTLYADSDSPGKALTVVGGSRHGEGFKFANKEYEAAVTNFLEKLSQNGQTGPASH